MKRTKQDHRTTLRMGRPPQSLLSNLAVGVSLSQEVGYQRTAFSADTWTWEIRPIMDKKISRWYLSFNPALDRSFHGPSVNKGVKFSPNFKFSFDLTSAGASPGPTARNSRPRRANALI